MAQTYSSESDSRAANNNVMRHEYRVLTDEEKLQMKEIKDKGLDFVKYINAIGEVACVLAIACSVAIAIWFLASLVPIGYK